MPVSFTGFAASNSAENEWCASAAPDRSMPATSEAATMRTFILRSSNQLGSRSARCSCAIVLTEIDGHLALDPLELPTARPRFRIGTRIVDRDLIAQRVVVGAREALGQRR